MKTNRRNFLSLFLALILSLSALPISRLTAVAATSGDFEYSVLSEADKTCQITKYTGSDAVLNIPLHLDGYTVTGIGAYAFQDCSSLTDITIPVSVTSIDMFAFGGCATLESVTIPGSVTSIGMGAFYGCTALAGITIPESVKSIGDGAFYYCTSLTGIAIPESVTSIGEQAFDGCTSLISITIPDSVTSIGAGAFDNTAYYNTESNWDNDVLYIGNHLIKAKNTFGGDYPVKQGTKTICGRAFRGCTSITGVTIPESMTNIGNYAFQDCTSLTNVIIPDSVTNIGVSAFEGCNGIRIIGFDNSAAKTYAEEYYGIEFYLIGDMDVSGAYESNDYGVLVSKIFCQKVDSTAPEEVGDINLDGAVDGFDAVQLDLYLNGTTDIHGNKIA